jgi:hypothetical protein
MGGSGPERVGEQGRSHSGRLLLRMPKTLHAELAARSDAAGMSLNQYIVSALARAVSETDGDGPPPPPPPPVMDERRDRSLRNALLANAVVVALAALTAIVLLVVALR